MALKPIKEDLHGYGKISDKEMDGVKKFAGVKTGKSVVGDLLKKVK